MESQQRSQEYDHQVPTIDVVNNSRQERLPLAISSDASGGGAFLTGVNPKNSIGNTISQAKVS